MKDWMEVIEDDFETEDKRELRKARFGRKVQSRKEKDERNIQKSRKQRMHERDDNYNFKP